LVSKDYLAFVVVRGPNELALKGDDLRNPRLGYPLERFPLGPDARRLKGPQGHQAEKSHRQVTFAAHTFSFKVRHGRRRDRGVAAWPTDNGADSIAKRTADRMIDGRA